MIAPILYWVLTFYFLVLIGRLIFDWIMVFSREWRPRGVLLIIAEAIYSLTDPPIHALRKVIPPLRLGGVALDMGFLILILGVSILRGIVLRLPI